ncbi:hypothetical protein IE53DRAFT_386039 [Violaceomyces palustris]|uniref:Uncharacterized protein n=1 Tax=Violaceomyces palustris TaxID=1673888 RepID=A0ACD0P0W9_9BASI|nr:hypothetical protein IE53DRAFT_386039 [Violaceomyces palustris]
MYSSSTPAFLFNLLPAIPIPNDPQPLRASLQEDGSDGCLAPDPRLPRLLVWVSWAESLRDRSERHLTFFASCPVCEFAHSLIARIVSQTSHQMRFHIPYIPWDDSCPLRLMIGTMPSVVTWLLLSMAFVRLRHIGIIRHATRKDTCLPPSALLNGSVSVRDARYLTDYIFSFAVLPLLPRWPFTTRESQVVRYSALVGGIAYGISHRRTLQAREDVKAAKAAYKHKEDLIKKAKEVYAQRQVAVKADGVIMDPEHPNFDLEKALAKFEQDNK